MSDMLSKNTSKTPCKNIFKKKKGYSSWKSGDIKMGIRPNFINSMSIVIIE